MEVIAFFSVNDRNDDPAKKAECHETLLVIGQAIVFIRIGDTLKHHLGVDEVESVFPEIRPALCPIPGYQLWSVYTNRICVKGCFGFWPLMKATVRFLALEMYRTNARNWIHSNPDKRISQYSCR